MAVIVGKLCILGVAVDVINIAQEINIGPQAFWSGTFRISVEHGPYFFCSRIFLLLIFLLIFLLAHAFRLGRLVVRTRPHIRRVGFIVPHRIAEITVQEDIRLVHVTIHALGGRNGAGEGMLYRMAFFPFRWIDLDCMIVTMARFFTMGLCGWLSLFAMGSRCTV